MSQLKGSWAGEVPSHSALFFAIQAFSCLDEAHPHWERQSALLRLPIPMSISSCNHLHRHAQNHVLKMSGHPRIQDSDRLTEKINCHHSGG